MTRRLAVVAAAALALAGCARDALFVVLPNADGRPGAGAITVDDGKTKTRLDQPYAAAEARSGRAEAIDVRPDDARIIFNRALSARPILPTRFRLYFLVDSDTLTPESARDYRAVFDDIKRRPVYEVEVIGHTDTMGAVAYNQQLSLARAGAVRERLVHDGLSAGTIAIAGRGKLDLLVPTGDEVPEPKNRRVEITVR